MTAINEGETAACQELNELQRIISGAACGLITASSFIVPRQLKCEAAYFMLRFGATIGC